MQANEVSVSIKLQIISVLLDNKANPILKNNEEQTPLMLYVPIKNSSAVRSSQSYIQAIAALTEISAQIRPNGEVIFGDANKLIAELKPTDALKSGDINVKVLGIATP